MTPIGDGLPINRGGTPTPRTKRRMTPGDVERIVTPMKIKPKTLNLKRKTSLDSGYEGSNPNTAMTAQQYFTLFVSLMQHFRGSKINIKEVNKDIKKISGLPTIPGPGDLAKIKDEKVSQSPTLSSVFPLISLQFKKKIKKANFLVLKYIKSRVELDLDDFCEKLEEWTED